MTRLLMFPLLVVCFAAERVQAAPSPEKNVHGDRVISYEIPQISFHEATLAEAIEFFRYQATKALRSVHDDQSKLMIFELKFVPVHHPGSILHKKIDYEAKQVQLKKALADCLAPFGLTFQMLAQDRIAIIDPPENKTSEGGGPRR